MIGSLALVLVLSSICLSKHQWKLALIGITINGFTQLGSVTDFEALTPSCSQGNGWLSASRRRSYISDITLAGGYWYVIHFFPCTALR